MQGPTRFPELNDVLDELVVGVRAVLGENLCGVYLQGSFAVGDADEHSDVDFLAVTERPLGEGDQAALQAMHRQIYAFPTAWAQHLEGSYIARELLRRVDPARTPLLFLDNGATELEWDNHCNTAVVRWALREHGIALYGPDPKTLVDPVSPDELRAGARAGIDEWVAWLAARSEWSRWLQPYVVLTFCRLRHTLATGTVVSKRVAGEWAVANLDPAWASLIRQALDDRPDPWARVHQPAAAPDVARTWEFVSYASSARS